LICTLSKIPGFARWAKPGKAQSNKQESLKGKPSEMNGFMFFKSKSQATSLFTNKIQI